MVYSTRRFALCLTCVILFLCFSVLLALRLPSLGKRELILVLFVRLFDLCLFGVLCLFISRHTIVAGYYGITVAVRPSVCRTSVLSYFRFRMITSKCQCSFTKHGVCIDIVEIWFGIVNGQIELSARHRSIFSFPSDNLSK